MSDFWSGIGETTLDDFKKSSGIEVKMDLYADNGDIGYAVAAIADYVRYATPNKAAEALLPE